MKINQFLLIFHKKLVKKQKNKKIKKVVDNSKTFSYNKSGENV